MNNQRTKPPNATVHPPGPLQRRGVARKQDAVPVAVQRLVRRLRRCVLRVTSSGSTLVPSMLGLQQSFSAPFANRGPHLPIRCVWLAAKLIRHQPHALRPMSCRISCPEELLIHPRATLGTPENRAASPRALRALRSRRPQVLRFTSAPTTASGLVQPMISRQPPYSLT